MFRAGGNSINYQVRGADAESPPDIIRVFNVTVDPVMAWIKRWRLQEEPDNMSEKG